MRRNFRLEFAKEFSTWICEGMIFSESWSCFVFGYVQLALTCFPMWFVDSLKYLHKNFKRSPKSNSNFFTVNLPREQSFEKRIFFSALPNVYLYSSLVFVLKQSFYRKINSIQRIYCIVFDVILRRSDNDIVRYGTIFPESTLDFSNAWRMLFCFQIRFLRKLNLLHQRFNRSVRSDYNCFDVNFRKSHIFDSVRFIGIARGAFNCFYNMVSRSPNLVYSLLVFESKC